MATNRALVDNPSGLSTSNPMEDDGYRATVRAIADRFCKLKGQPPYPPVELEGVEQRAAAAREAEGVSRRFG